MCEAYRWDFFKNNNSRFLLCLKYKVNWKIILYFCANPNSPQLFAHDPAPIYDVVLYFTFREADELWIYEIWLSGELDGLRQLSDFLCFNSHYKGEDDDLDLNLCGGGKFPNTHREKLDNYKEEHDNPPEQREDIMDIGKHNQKWK